jgi:hypothetical protein
MPLVVEEQLVHMAIRGHEIDVLLIVELRSVPVERAGWQGGVLPPDSSNRYRATGSRNTARGRDCCRPSYSAARQVRTEPAAKELGERLMAGSTHFGCNLFWIGWYCS